MKVNPKMQGEQKQKEVREENKLNLIEEEIPM